MELSQAAAIADARLAPRMVGAMKQQAWIVRKWASDILSLGHSDDAAVIEKWHALIDSVERRGQRRGRLIGVFIGAALATAGGLLARSRC